MSKPINTINLDRLAKALNERCNTLIETEKERAQLRENDIEEIANQAIDMFGGKSIKYLSQIEYDLLSDEEKESDTVTYFITDAVDLSHEHENKEFLDSLNQEMLDTVNALTLNGYSLWVGTTAELEAITERDPNTLYFEIDDGTNEEVVQVDIVDGVLQLTDDMYQKTEMVTGTEIVFPEVSKFTEIHLYFNADEDMSITFPDCKWRVEPNIEKGNYYEIVVTYNTIVWLANVIVYSGDNE